MEEHWYQIEIVRHLGRIEIVNLKAAYIEAINGNLRLFDKDKQLLILIPGGLWGVVRPIPDPEKEAA